jgi:hypothetical protein
MTITANLHDIDGTLIKKVDIELDTYVPMKMLIDDKADGKAYYIRTSPDYIHNPVDFVKVQDLYIYTIPQS